MVRLSLALYRKYRPATFAEVVGQEHVTAPLQQALRQDRVHHAYLFSGPRGCGKTSSARILARSLNCEHGPTPEPCGQCDSCLALAPNGAGSLDVIEIDAASHGGVDDARDLRERAFFAPVSSRFKVYIVDEAHMVSREGFNALLKLVEEPPPHLKFVFATTEPEKVIGTIKSRTFHYPFRLVPPGVLRDHLAGICEQEGVSLDPLVLPLVVRAGGGSVRDALSVLDQLIAGAGPDGVRYEHAVALLGFTDSELLDEVVDAFAAGDGAAAFRIVDRVVESGHDPRRFAADVLERMRDLLVLDAVPDAPDSGLLAVPPDQLDRIRRQAVAFGRAALTRAADIFNTGLGEMKGTTTPRLQLELICARVLLPGAASDTESLLVRLERLERRASIGAAPAAPEPVRAPAAEPKPEQPEQPARPERPEPTPAAAEAAAEAAEEPAVEPPPAAQGLDGMDGIDAAGVRRVWADVLEGVKHRKRATQAMLLDAQVVGADAGSLTLEFQHPAIRRQFDIGINGEVLAEALREVLGVDWKVVTTVKGDGASDASAAAPAGDRSGAPGAQPGSPARGGSTTAAPGPPPPADVEADLDDPDDAETPGDPMELLEQRLGARVIGEIDNS